MNVIDLAIIYFAFGAPFGVHYLTQFPSKTIIRKVCIIAASILFWPALAFASILNWLRNPLSEHNDTSNDRVDQIRTAIEKLAFDNDAVASLFEFREIFNRYVGLVEAAHANSTDSAVTLANMPGQPDSTLAQKCRARRNREKLAFHQMKARIELVEVISDLSMSRNARNEIVTLAIELAKCFGDRDAEADLEAILMKRSGEVGSIDAVANNWKAQVRPTTIIP